MVGGEANAVASTNRTEVHRELVGLEEGHGCNLVYSFRGVEAHELRNLDEWLDRKLPGVVGSLTATVISGGASNIIYEIARGEHAWVLRRPPNVAISPTAHNVAREYRVLLALEGSNVPHPRPLLLCEDAGVIGASFLVMEKVDGFTTRPPRPDFFDRSPNLQRAVGFAFVDALAELWRVDWMAAGLDGYGKPDGFLDRQVDRWLGQLEQVRNREVRHIDEVASWLREHRPRTQRVGIVHGDYHTNNLIYRLSQGRVDVAAIVDWEQSTVGDSLVDLGWGLSLWEEPGEPPLLPSDYGLGRYPGTARRSELAERFAAKTGADVSDVDYYRVLALFKLACILEGSYYRYLTGASTNPHHADNREFVPRLVERAWALVA